MHFWRAKITQRRRRTKLFKEKTQFFDFLTRRGECISKLSDGRYPAAEMPPPEAHMALPQRDALFPMKDAIGKTQHADSKDKRNQETYYPAHHAVGYFPVHPRLNPVKGYDADYTYKNMREPLHKSNFSAKLQFYMRKALRHTPIFLPTAAKIRSFLRTTGSGGKASQEAASPPPDFNVFNLLQLLKPVFW